MSIKIFRILRYRTYFFIALFSFIAMLFIYPVVQSIPTGGIQNIDLWFKLIRPLNLYLYILFSFVFGVLLALQVYNFRHMRNCKLVNTSTGLAGAFSAFFVSQCPACVSLASFFLPLGTVGFLSVYNTYFMIGSLLLMLLGLVLLGGFKKH